MMALFTTIPASEIIPTPDMMMPKGMRKIIRPMSTPTVDMITDVMMISGFTTELNWLMRMKQISSSAVRNAPPRKAWASAWSSDWPV